MDSIRPIRALVRGLEALAVINSRGGATVSEVARELALPRTTVYRLLETLRDSDFVYRDVVAERYLPTILVRNLSAGFNDEDWVSQAVRPHLLALGESVVWPVNVAAMSGKKLMVRDATDHFSPLAVERFSVGMPLPILDTSSGLCYLSCCDDSERAELLAADAARDSEMTASMARIRQAGYATAARTLGPTEELSISVPVLSQHLPLAVLTVRFAASAMPMEVGLMRFLPKLRRCAATIGATRGAVRTVARGH